MTDRSVRVIMQAEMRQLRRELSATGAEAKKTARETEDAFKRSGKSIDEAAAKAKAAADKQAAVSRRVAEMRRAETMATERAATAVGRGAIALEQYRSEWDQVGTTALRGGAAFTAAAVLVAKAAIDWESAWAGVLKTADTDDPLQLAQLESDLRHLATTMPESHKSIAATAEAAGQLGVATEDVAAFTRVMVMLGDTTDLTAEGAATELAQLMNIMRTAPDDVDNLGASLVALGNNGASTESQILGMAQRIAGAGEIVGLTEAQVLGVANAVASSGIEVEAGGSAISAVLIKLESAVMSGGDKLDLFAKTAGMSAAEFAASWRGDPATALADFTEGLGRVKGEGGNVFAVLDQLGMSDIRVTRAMLNMANSGDMLRESLAMGTQSFADNTALTDEAAKRYDTAAAKAQIAWNGIKDNAIDAGQGLLPVVASVSDAVSSLADMFGSLPGPVKSSLGVLAGGTGVALLTAGGFMKLAGSVADSYGALARLNSVAPGVGGKLTALAKGATAAVLAVTALRVVGDVIDYDDVASVEDFTEAIINLDGAASALDLGGVLSNSQGIVSQIQGLSDLSSAIKEADPGWLNDKFGSLFGVIKMNPYGDAKEDVEQYDRALTALADSGATAEAEKGYNAFAKAAKESGKDLEDVEKLLPGYTAALKRQSNEAKIAANEQDAFADSNKALSMRLAELDPDTEKASAALRKIQEDTRSAAMGFLDFTGGLDLNKVSLREWVGELEKMAEAQADWADNVIVAMARGVDQGVIAKFKELGPEGARMLDQLVNGSQKDIDRLNAAFGDFTGTADLLAELDGLPTNFWIEFQPRGEETTIEAAARVAAAYGDIDPEVETILRAMGFNEADIKAWRALLEDLPPRKNTEITAEDNASTIIAGINAMLNSLDPYKRITIETHRVNTGGGNGGSGRQTINNADGGFFDRGRVRAFADGGIDEYGRAVPRTPQMRDSGKGAVMWGEPETRWEAYISGKPGMEERNRSILALAAQRLGGVVAFADGGFTEAVSSRELTDMRIRVRDLRRALAEKETVGKGKKKHKRPVLRGLDRLQARQELAEAEHDLAEQRRLRRNIGEGKRYRTAGAYNRAMETRETARSDAESLRDLDADAFRSPAALERALSNMLRDQAEFTTLYAALRKKGASKWLLQQLRRVGPSRATNRTMRTLLNDTDQLKRLNADAAQLDFVTNSYSSVMAGGSLTAAQTAQLNGVSGADLQAFAQTVATATVVAARNIGVRTVDYREYQNQSAAQYPSPVAGVLS